MKTNFKKLEDTPINNEDKKPNEDKKINVDLSQKEFEDFMMKSNSKGSFMVYRSEKKDEELGIDEL
jgi:hypothetical protein